MSDLILKRRLGEATWAPNIALNGVPPASPATATEADVFWRWEDEPTMEPQRLGRVSAGHTLSVPFDLKGRMIRLFLVSRTATGLTNIRTGFADAVQTTFSAGLPVLSVASFSAPDVTLTIANNGGTGTIRILRQLGSADYVQVGTVSPGTTSFVDTPAINGTYNYKLTQDGQTGESNTKSVTVTGGGSGAGTPPDTLSGSFDGVDTVTLTWTNHGGTGLNVVERKTGPSGTYTEVGSVPSGTATLNDTLFPGSLNQLYYYRVRNADVTGYSNEEVIFVPAA
jgi:hypothetical protein